MENIQNMKRDIITDDVALKNEAIEEKNESDELQILQPPNKALNRKKVGWITCIGLLSLGALATVGISSYKKGQKDSYINGVEIGCNLGRYLGFKNGYDFGYDDGFREGYNEGYYEADGYYDCDWDEDDF